MYTCVYSQNFENRINGGLSVLFCKDNIIGLINIWVESLWELRRNISCELDAAKDFREWQPSSKFPKIGLRINKLGDKETFDKGDFAQ